MFALKSAGHLKENSYSASIMNDLVFEETVLLSKEKELKKKGKQEKCFHSFKEHVSESHFIVLSLLIVISLFE